MGLLQQRAERPARARVCGVKGVGMGSGCGGCEGLLEGLVRVQCGILLEVCVTWARSRSQLQRTCIERWGLLRFESLIIVGGGGMGLWVDMHSSYIGA